MATIVLIEDDEHTRTALQRMLESFGHTVSAAATGRDGLFQARHSAPDLVLTDINLPDKDGLEILIELRHSHRQVKVIAMSGSQWATRDDLLTMARHLGACAVLSKPFTPEDLDRAVNTALASEVRALAFGRH